MSEMEKSGLEGNLTECRQEVVIWSTKYELCFAVLGKEEKGNG